MIKISIQQEEIISINIYVPNTGVLNCMRQVLPLNRETDCNMVIVRASISHLHEETDHPDKKTTKKYQREIGPNRHL